MFKETLVSCGKGRLMVQVLISIVLSGFVDYQGAHGCG